MLKEFFDALGRVKSRPLLVVFTALAVLTFTPGAGPIRDPFSVASFALPFFVFAADVAVGSWVLFVRKLNSRLADHDHASWGPVLGGTALAFCLCVSFWYVSNFPDPFNLKLFGNVVFVRMLALYLFAIETININR
ncbi:hypothetical protein [Pseudomonas sp. H3(2019)]|uniref:hypothetical protein n=1 Tax=Pseudomonas sp. H3(2019) TaxID=2598724 RepID=UPI00118F983F|nr:hypothetical protein [Pseudomonas sp. H3(2019)]TVT83973.1 hypothetical protein FPT12_10190 [Pseudomonas sp. H3(2019)]